MWLTHDFYLSKSFYYTLREPFRGILTLIIDYISLINYWQRGAFFKPPTQFPLLFHFTSYLAFAHFFHGWLRHKRVCPSLALFLYLVGFMHIAISYIQPLWPSKILASTMVSFPFSWLFSASWDHLSFSSIYYTLPTGVIINSHFASKKKKKIHSLLEWSHTILSHRKDK